MDLCSRGVEPDSADIIQARRGSDGVLFIELQSDSGQTVLTLINVENVSSVDGVKRDQWSWERPLLTIKGHRQAPVEHSERVRTRLAMDILSNPRRGCASVAGCEL